VVPSGGTSKEVIGQTQLRQVFDDETVILICQLPRGDTFVFGGDQDGSAVLVSSGNHQDLVALHAHVTGKHIRGDAKTSDVTDMTRTVGIRPGNSRKNMTHSPDSINHSGTKKPTPVSPQHPRTPKTRTSPGGKPDLDPGPQNDLEPGPQNGLEPGPNPDLAD